MSLPQNVLSDTPQFAPFLAPRTTIRFSASAGQRDVHYGGVHIGDTSGGIQAQLWSAVCDGANIYLSAPNTPQYAFLTGIGAAWVVLAFDQNARVFLAWATVSGAASYYWYDTLISNYRTSFLGNNIYRVFASLDDARPLESGSADIILAYERSAVLYYRQQRDRYGAEYNLGAAPAGAALVQIGMNHVNRFQFAFQNVQGNNEVPPAEYKGPFV